MKITLTEAVLENMLKHLEEHIHQAGSHYKREIRKLHCEVRTKKPSLQLYRKIKAIIVKILAKVNQSYNDAQFIEEKTLSQNTYHKTITSRP